MADLSYGLLPWVFGVVDGLPTNVPPVGAVSVLDGRRLADVAAKTPTNGVGFFSWPRGQRPPEAISLGDGDVRTIAPTTAQRDAIKSCLGLSARPDGATLAETIADAYGDKSDPTGVDSPGPLMPDRNGEVSIHLAGHSKVFARRMSPGDILAKSPKGHASRIRDVWAQAVENAFDSAKEGHKLQHAAKVLGCILKRCGYTDDELANGAGHKREEWGRLLSPSCKAKVGGAFVPQRPSTLATETWPTAAADLTGSAQDQVWTELATDGFADGLKVNAATLRATSAFTNRLGICAATVSSSDHYAEATLTGAVGAGSAYVTARQHASRGSFYAAGWNYAQSRRLYKCVLGTLTQLAAETVLVAPAGVVVRCDCDGSTITGLWPTLADQVVTDTSNPTGTRGGGWIYLDAPVETYGQIGAWALNDGLAAGLSGGMLLFGVS